MQQGQEERQEVQVRMEQQVGPDRLANLDGLAGLVRQDLEVLPDIPDLLVLQVTLDSRVVPDLLVQQDIWDILDRRGVLE